MASSSSPRRSRSHQGSQIFNPSASTSRPFLNMLNPMARQYQGYSQANQSLLEEDEGSDIESGRSPRDERRKGRRVSWDAGASELHTLHANIHREDKIHEESSDDEVPQSFMIETPSNNTPTNERSSKVKGKAKATSSTHERGRPLHSTSSRKLPPVLPTHSPVSVPPRPYETGLESPRLSPGTVNSDRTRDSPDRPRGTMRGLDDYERALWNWVNVYNLDAFLQEAYYYYEGKGLYSIALARGLNLLTIGFVIGFSTFLLGCIDYSKVVPDKNIRLPDVIIPRCVSRFSGFTLLFFIPFTAYYLWQIASFILGIHRLVDMYNFYTHLLNIPDVDIQTIAWSEVVRRIGAIREDNPLTAISSKRSHDTNDTTTAKLDAHDIANRIMRQENYLIALFNKELLDLRVPLPSVLKRFVPEESGKGKVLTQALEWNLRFCLMEYLFDSQGRVRKVFLKSKNRTALIEGLQRRLIFMGILNAIFAPFIVIYLLMYSFFRYFEEYHKNPSTIGGRRYTSYAQWKFREFNELPHFFVRRLDESYPYASMYIGQFPNEKMTLIMRFVAFISGSFVAVLFLATVLDPDIFVHFEITPHRTVLFYLGVFGSILAVARGMIPEDNRVFDPEMLMTEVILYTHYMPNEWKEELHSKKTHEQFGELFQMKIVIFFVELLSVVLTPFVLWFSLPECAPAIIDFFREFTVHVEGRGYVCSFAEFNFERHGNVKFGAPTGGANQRMVSNDGKMEKSFLNFKATNPEWNPTDPTSSLYLSRMAELHAPGSLLRRRPHHSLTGDTPPPPPMSGSAMFDRGQEYDRALMQSQMTARRRGMGGSTILGTSTLAQGPGGSSIFAGLANAQTVVLGDSHMSVPTQPKTPTSRNIDEEDLAPDGGIGSGLGESYVDGGKRSHRKDGDDEAEDEMDDGGVLGLLAQIYARRDGQTQVL